MDGVFNSSEFSLLCQSKNVEHKASLFKSTVETFIKIFVNNTWVFVGFALIISIKVLKTCPSLSFKNEKYHGELLALVCFLSAILITPIIVCFVPVITCYRLLIFLYLKQKWRHSFKGLFKGPDVMWAIETPESRSIINVLILLDMPFVKMKYYPGIPSIGKDLLHTIRNITDKSFLQPTSPFPKLKWLRQKCRLGYSYWIHSDKSTIEHFVRPLEIMEQCHDGLTKNQLEVLLGKYSNYPLPFDDQGTWEILVGQQHFVNTEMKKLYPILVRIHHSVGDGVALVRLFLEGLVDRDYTGLPAFLRKTNWAESRQINSSTESAEYDNNNNDDDSDEEKREVQPSQSSTPKSLPDSSYNGISSHNVITPQILTYANPRNNFKEKISNTLKNIKTKLSKNKSPTSNTLAKTTFLSPLKIKSFYLKDRPVSIVSKLCRSPGLVKRSNLSVSEMRTCVVPPRPRSVSPIPTAPTMIEHETKALVRTKRSLSFINIQDCAMDSNEHHNSGKHDIFFEKCIPSKKNSTQSFSGAKDEIQFKNFLLYFVVAFIIAAVCIQRTLAVYCRILSPKIRKYFRFCYLTPHLMFCQIFNAHKNVLHGEKLSGIKILGWVTDESDFNKRFRTKINRIRKHYGVSTKFTHVLYACLSKSLHKYYLRRNAPVPPYINVVLPARVNLDDLSAGCETTARCDVGNMKTKVTRLYRARKIPRVHRPANLSFSSSNESDQEDTNQKIENIHKALSKTSIKSEIKLENKFTVAMIKLPVGSVPLDQDMRLLQAIQDECHRLKNGPDYLANYWLLRWFAHLVPNLLLEPFLKAAPCTLVFSNLPGPEEVANLSRIPINDIIFWVPNRGLNGVGIGMMSYCGRFSAGIIIDKALIPNDNDAQDIVRGIYDEVNLFKCSQ